MKTDILICSFNTYSEFMPLCFSLHYIQPGLAIGSTRKVPNGLVGPECQASVQLYFMIRWRVLLVRSEV